MKRPSFLLILCLLALSAAHAQHTITSERIEVTSRLDASPDPEALRIMQQFKPAVDSVMAPVLGESLVGMSAARPESLLSNWAADVMVESSEVFNGKRADLGLVNIGGLRNNMPKGPVRRGDILLISPFDNRLAIAHLTGTDLLALFQDVAAVHGEGLSKEVQLTITKDGRLTDAKVGGQDIDPNRIYRIATLDYLAEGNDHLYSLKKAQRVEVSKIFIRDCMMQFIERHKAITSKIEGRVKVEP